jgi:NAD(P)-dependent dehydrogenase (short-subunit alcohol dehydrogenase family)
MPAQKVALVTGASRNIGRSIALALARRGYALACFGRDAAALDETVQLIRALGMPASVFVGDAKSNASLQDFVEHAVQTHGGIDAVINNAGIVVERRPEEVTPEEFSETLQVNLVSQFTLARAAYAPLRARGGGVIINIGSLAGTIAFPRTVAYCASKAGVDGLTRALAYDWAGDNIRVLCVAPGYVKSDISKDVLADARTRDWILRRIPLRRVAEPDEIAEFTAFLASDAAGFCTGETYYVDGGQRTAI